MACDSIHLTSRISDPATETQRKTKAAASPGSLHPMVEQSRFAAVEDGELVMDWREFQARVGD